VVAVLRWTFSYLDAGTGSMIVQLLLCGIAAIGVTVSFGGIACCDSCAFGVLSSRPWSDIPDLKRLAQPIGELIFVGPNTAKRWSAPRTSTGLTLVSLRCAV
jgi:hypothetical protein